MHSFARAAPVLGAHQGMRAPRVIKRLNAASRPGMWGATMLQHLRRGAAVAPVPLVRLVAGPNRLGSAPAHWSLAAAASWRAATKLTAGARRLCAMHPTRVVRVDGDETQVCDAPHALLHVLFSHAPEMHGGQHTEHAILTQVTARDPPEACILTEVTTLHSPPLQGAAATDVTKRVVQVRLCKWAW